MEYYCQLITPVEDFCTSYKSYLCELQQSGEKPVPFVLKYDCDDFIKLLDRLKKDSLGEGLQDWQVTCSTFWLIDEQSEIVGVSNLRHVLNDALRHEGGHIGFGIRPSARRKGYGTAILRETLVKAKEKDINEVLVTCDKSNVGSARIITNNGGVLQSEEYIESEKDFLQRYLISD